MNGLANLTEVLGAPIVKAIITSGEEIVGGRAGGGFEWKAGGIYAKTGIDRTGLAGCTALDLFKGRIYRMSVKFDTFQMSAAQYEDIRIALADAGVVDQ